MVRFGIVGFGLHAVRRLMPGFRLSKRCSVTALSRRTLDKAQASAKEYSIPFAFDSTEALCRSSEVDAILVTTPNALHLQDVLTAIRYGKPVLCEKPMAMNGDECRTMVEAARAAKVPLGVAQVFRFEESTRRFRERVAAGDTGRVVFVRSEFSFPARTHARTWLNDSSLAGGGPIADVGVHCVDALRYILQDEVARVSARTVSDKDSGTVEAAAVLALEFARGTLGTVMVSTRAEYRTPLEIVGESGVLRADDALNVERPVTIELKKGISVVEKETVSNLEAYARQVDGFAMAIEENRPVPVPGDEGWQNQLVLDAAFRSAKTGKVETVERVIPA